VKVELVGHTVFTPPDVPWEPDNGLESRDADVYYGGQDLIEFAGRACYQSWNRPNPSTATNEGYLANIIGVGHWSVLEHSSASFYFTGVSRSLTHELVRHRHLSFSQLSQRYVALGDSDWVLPPELADVPEAEEVINELDPHIGHAYRQLIKIMENRLANVEDKTERRKRARQAARCVLPNMTETRIVVTGNYRAWAHFIFMRAAKPADVEIRALAVEVLRQLQELAPNVFNHYKIIELPDGTEAAEGPIV
jgi:thymidylate synthase (FAD)